MADKFCVEWPVVFNIVRVVFLFFTLVFSLRAGAETKNIDPTRPDVKEEILREKMSIFEYTLSMIIKNKENNYAIINGVMLKENEEIAGAVVKWISESKVMLDKNGKKIILNLYGVKVFQ